VVSLAIPDVEYFLAIDPPGDVKLELKPAHAGVPIDDHQMPGVPRLAGRE